MRRLLMLAYFFPPLGGAGVQRALKFAKYLPEFGYEVSVVTGPGDRAAQWAPLDETLSGELGDRARIHRAAGSPALSVETSRLERRLQRYLGRPTRFTRAWIRGAYEAGLRAASADRPDIVFATMSPFESCAPAARLSNALGIPWVADLRDPWALDEIMLYPTGWHRRWELRRMLRGLASAAAIVMNTPEAERAIRAELPGYAHREIYAIPNGFDAEDFAGPDPARGGRFRIVHTGHLHWERGMAARRSHWRRWLGGERIPVDVLPRSHYFLVEALARWAEEDPSVYERVELCLVGPRSVGDEDFVRRRGIESMVRFTGYLPHAESLAELRRADLLFLPMHKIGAGERARIVPGKTYEYLAARRPILAAVPHGDARDWLLRSGRAEICEPDDVAGMQRALKKLCRENAPQPAESTTLGDPLLHCFERRELTRSLARILDQTLDTREIPEVRPRAAANRS